MTFATRAYLLVSILVSVTHARAQPGNFVDVLEGRTSSGAPSAADVDAAIADALKLEREGLLDSGLERLRDVTRLTAFRCAKVRYFLARLYRDLLARELDPSRAAELERLMLHHLEGARDLSRDGSYPDNARWAASAGDRLGERASRRPLDVAIAVDGRALRRGDSGPAVADLQRRLGVEPTGIFGETTERVLSQYQRDHGLTADGVAGPETLAALQGARPSAGGASTDPGPARPNAVRRATPVLDQYASGSYPGGYCAPTSLRMVLRHEGLPDPGADAVALGGARPYRPGAGSDPSRLAARARELGLTGATFRSSGSLAAIGAAVDAGRSIPVGGVGPFSALREGGGVKARSYPAGHWLVVTRCGRDAQGRVEWISLNDPDGGLRVLMTRAEFLRFFSPEGDGHVWMIDYTYSGDRGR